MFLSGLFPETSPAVTTTSPQSLATGEVSRTPAISPTTQWGTISIEPLFPTMITSPTSSTPSTSITILPTLMSDGATTVVTVTEPEPLSVTTATEPPARSVTTGNGSTLASSRVHAIITIIGSVLGVVLLISVVLYARWRWHRGNTNDSLRGRRLDITGEDSVHNTETNKHSFHVSSNGDISGMDRFSPGDMDPMNLNCSETTPISLTAPAPLRHSFPDSKAPSGTVLPDFAANDSDNPGLLRRANLLRALQEDTTPQADTNPTRPQHYPPENDVQPQPRAFGPRAPLISYSQLYGVRPRSLHHRDPEPPVSSTQESATRRRRAVDGGISLCGGAVPRHGREETLENTLNNDVGDVDALDLAEFVASGSSSWGTLPPPYEER